MAEMELPHEAIEEESTEVRRNKQIALWIGALAVMLALVEILGQQAQVSSVQNNIEAANQWAFFQAKAERETTYGVAIDTLEVLLQGLPEKARADARQKVEHSRAAAATHHADPRQ